MEDKFSDLTMDSITLAEQKNEKVPRISGQDLLELLGLQVTLLREAIFALLQITSSTVCNVLWFSCNGRPFLTTFNTKGGAVAEWSKALLVRENKRKSKRSQVRPPTWAPLKKNFQYKCLVTSSSISILLKDLSSWIYRLLLSACFRSSRESRLRPIGPLPRRRHRRQALQRLQARDAPGRHQFSVQQQRQQRRQRQRRHRWRREVDAAEGAGRQVVKPPREDRLRRRQRLQQRLPDVCRQPASDELQPGLRPSQGNRNIQVRWSPLRSQHVTSLNPV